MEWRFSANVGFFGLRRDRFTEYQPQRSLPEKLALVAQIEGLAGVELKYPADFTDLQLVRRLLDEHGLALAAVNVDLKDAQHFRHSALSARATSARERAVALLREGMDVAAELGSDLVTTCPVADGFDYPFQVDYAAAWGRLIESLRSAATHRADVRLCVEYQPHEPHARALLGNVAKVLYVCAEVGLPNLGANLDIGHALAAGEAPAESAALLARAGRLFYIHTNDNTGEGGDWDMLSGSVHFWHWVELLHTLKRMDYTGWLGADIAPRTFGPVEAYATNIRLIHRMSGLLERIDGRQLDTLLAQDGSVPNVYELLTAALISPPR